MVALTATFLLVSPLDANAQEIAGCVEAELQDPPRRIYECQNGLVFEAEISADIQFEDRRDQEGPGSINLDDAAVLIDLERGGEGFQVRTPFAIASVRGTQFIVDVQNGQSSVFVTEGEVLVSRADGSDTVSLTPGLGVDVAPGADLVTRNWPQDRVEALLARFGR